MHSMISDDISDLGAAPDNVDAFVIPRDALLCFQTMVLNTHSLLPMFGAIPAPHRCNIQQLNHLNWTFEQIVNFTNPKALTDSTGGNVIESCHMYDFNYTSFSSHFDTAMQQKLAWGLNNTQQISCQDGYIFNTETALFKWSYATEFQLVCDKKHLVPYPTSVCMLGLFFGVLSSGFLSDRYGRRSIECIVRTCTLIMTLACSVAPEYYSFLAFRFVNAFFEISDSTVVWVWCSEVFGQKQRVLMRTLSELFWIVNTSIIVGTAYWAQNWRIWNASFTWSALLLPFMYWMMPESPRWLYAKGRSDKANKVLKHIASVNKKEFHIDRVDVILRDEAGNIQSNHEVSVANKHNYFTLMRTPHMRRRSLIMTFVWFTVAMMYYGFTFGSVTLPGNIYVNAILNNATGFITMPIHFLIIKYFGRKRPQIVGFAFIGVFSCLAGVFLLIDNSVVKKLSIVVASMGKAICDITFSIAYLYTAELMPTVSSQLRRVVLDVMNDLVSVCGQVVRNIGTSACSSAARIGATITPFIGTMTHYWRPAPLIVYATMAFVTAALSCALPETTNQPMPQTVADVERPRTAVANSKPAVLVDIDAPIHVQTNKNVSST